MADRISGSSRRELPPGGFRPVWGGENEGAPRGMAALARCGLRLSSSFIIFVEFDGQDTLRVRFAVPVTPDGNPTHGQIPPGIELSRRIEMRGRVVVASDYAGCPWCGGEIIFRCGCGGFAGVNETLWLLQSTAHSGNAGGRQRFFSVRNLNIAARKSYGLER
jgi:hypothetical protein